MAQIITNFEPDKKATVDEFIRAGKRLSLSHESTMLKYKLDEDTIIPMQSIFQKHMSAFQKYIFDYEMSDSEFSRWQYQPKLVSRELYGTPELWSDLLFINNMTSCVEFNKRNVKLFQTSIIDAIHELLMLQKQVIKDNRSDIK